MRIPLFCAVAVLGLSACHKGSGLSEIGVPLSLRSLFNANRDAAAQHFHVQANMGGVLTGQDGTRIVIAPNAFRDQNGHVVTGMVDLELVEALRTGDMLWLNMQTVGVDNDQRRALKSGGEMRLRATCNGQQVNVTAGAATIEIPSNVPDPDMRQFVGDENGGVVEWQQAGPAIVVADTLTNDTLGEGSAYSMAWPPFDFINCDHYPAVTGTTTDITVHLPSGHDHSNSTVWVVLPDLNCMVYMEQGSENTWVAGCPVQVGQPGVIVALSDIGGSYYSTFTPITVVQGQESTVGVSPTTVTQFHDDCDAL